MLKNFKTSFILLKENMLLIQPLIIFLLIMTFAILPLQALKNNITGSVCVLVNLLLLTIAFLSGWFAMIKQTITNYRGTNSYKLTPKEMFKPFFSNIGEYFFPLTLNGLIFILLTSLISISVFKLGVILFSNPQLLAQALNQATLPLQQQAQFLNSLSSADLISLNKWIIYVAFCYFIVNLLILFYPAILFFKTKNPLKAIYYSCLMLIKKPIQTIGIYVILLIFNFLVSALSILGNSNILIFFISLFISLTFFTYYFMVIFLSYEEYNNCNNRPDC